MNPEEKKSVPGKGRRMAFKAVTFGACIAVLAAITVLAGPVAAVVAVAAALWVALFVTSRRLKRTRATIAEQIGKVTDRYDSMIELLSGALGLRDDMKANHSRRVAYLASVVAWQMGLRKEDIRLIQKAAIMHEIGKIGVAEAIVSKPGALNKREWDEMKRHPELGYQVLSEVRELQDAAQLLLFHHERFDGQGYPHGLRGEEIPLGCRIYAVVDAYAAMTVDRPYRKKIPHDLAVQEIVRNSLTQFDPQVVRAFLEAEERNLINARNGVAETREGEVPAVSARG
jgi:HD-GYP domain-containing protein (c-di-GMP phosphodiesterase class II)